MKKHQLFVYLDKNLMAKVEDLASWKRQPKSVVAEAAIASFVTPDDSDRREAAFARRFDRLTRQVERLERDVRISIEALALFVRFWLTVTPSLPAARRQQRTPKAANVSNILSRLSVAASPKAKAWRTKCRSTLLPKSVLRLLRRPVNRLIERRPPMRREANARGARMLRTALGPAIAGFLENVQVAEVMLNPDGKLWIDRLIQGISDTGERISATDAERIVRLVAHHVGVEVHARSPRVSAEIPGSGVRFEGLIPPVVTAPIFAIRKPATMIISSSPLRKKSQKGRAAW
jgi:hypothetical protein